MTEDDAPRERPAVAHYLDWYQTGDATFWRYLGAITLAYVPLGAAAGVADVVGEGRDPATQQALKIGALAVALPLVLWVVRKILKRPGWTSFAPSWPPRFRRWLLALVVGWASMVVSYLLLLPLEEITYRGWGAAMDVSVGLLVFLIVGFIGQTATEEIMFRGLMMQELRLYMTRAALIIGVQAVLFGWLHRGNIAELGLGPLAYLMYIFPALVYGWAAWRTGSLMWPMGLHFANNSFLLLFVSTEGDVVTGPAPFLLATPATGQGVLFAVVQSVLMAIGVLAFTRKVPVSPARRGEPTSDDSSAPIDG